MDSHTIAGLVVVIHFLFIVFGLFGGLLVLYRKWFAYIHLPAAVWIVLIEVFGWVCPLTILEYSLRAANGGAPGDQIGFIEQYLVPIIYPVGLTRNVQLILGTGAFIINAAIYYFAWRKWHKH